MISILIVTLSQGNYTSAVLLFDHMIDDEVLPNATTFAAMLDIYSRYIVHLTVF